ncbi:MAG: rhomboid family intramembrane serine protease [Thermoleophilaceae bacterium]
MIPLKDNIPTRRFPIVTVALIALNVVAFIFFQHASPHSDGFHVSEPNTVRYALIPYRLLHPDAQCGERATVVDATQELDSPGQPVCEGQTVPTNAGPETVARAIPRNQPPALLTILSSMFMHGGLLHIGFNMLFLWIFGNNVEDSLGRVRFIVFYLLGGAVAALAQTAIDPSSAVPTLGASGAIAAVLGAYALLYPRARVITVVFIFFFFTLVELPALLVLGLWFLLQLADAQILSSGGGGGVAYFAHIGGFLFGLAAIRLFVRGRSIRGPEGLPVH